MQIPIPNDWNGQRWECFTITWPNSPQWIALLMGFLSQATRGRFWDEKTGSIQAAQAVGWEIFDSNIPLETCAGLIAPILGGSGAMFGSGILDIGGDDMPCIDISSMLKMENGVLYARDSCCQWIAIGSFTPGSSSENLGTEPLNPTGEPGVTYYACGKADALINKMRAVALTAWDTRDAPPWTYGSEFHKAHPDLDGGSLQFTTATVVALNLDILTSEDDVFDVNDTNALKSWLSGKLADDAAGITESQYADLNDQIYSQYAGGFNAFDPVAKGKADFWSAVLGAIGPGDARNITQLGAATVADCTEPTEPFQLFPGWGQGLAWSHVIDFRLPSLPAGMTLRLADIDTIHTSGIGLWSEVSSTMDSTEVAGTIPIVGTPTGVVTRVGLALKTVGDDNFGSPTSWMVWLDDAFVGLMPYSAIMTPAGDDPSAPGNWQLTAICNGPYTGGHPSKVEIDVIAQHPPQTNPPSSPTVSNVVIGLALAGTGDDPFPLLP